MPSSRRSRHRPSRNAWLSDAKVTEAMHEIDTGRLDDGGRPARCRHASSAWHRTTRTAATSTSSRARDRGPPGSRRRGPRDHARGRAGIARRPAREHRRDRLPDRRRDRGAGDGLRRRRRPGSGKGLRYADEIEQSYCRHVMAAVSAHVAWAEGRWDEAIAVAEIELVERGSRRGTLGSRDALGYVAFGRGDVERARALLEASLEIGRRCRGGRAHAAADVGPRRDRAGRRRPGCGDRHLRGRARRSRCRPGAVPSSCRSW